MTDLLETIVEHYAHITAAPDPAIRAGWADYLRKRVLSLEKAIPGIQLQIRRRARELMKESAC